MRRFAIQVAAMIAAVGCGGPAFPTAPPEGGDGGGVAAGFSAMPVPTSKRDPAKAKCPVVEKLQSQGNIVASWREALAGMEGLVHAAKSTPASDVEAMTALCPRCTDPKRPALVDRSGPHGIAHAYVVPRKDGKLSVHVFPRPGYTPRDCDGQGMLTGSGKTDGRYVELFQTQRIDERECIDIRSRYLIDHETGEMLAAAHGPLVKHGKDNIVSGISDDETSYSASLFGGGCPDATVLVR